MDESTQENYSDEDHEIAEWLSNGLYRGVQHGVRRYTKYGCRCTFCLAAKKADMKAYWARRKSREGLSPQ